MKNHRTMNRYNCWALMVVCFGWAKIVDASVVVNWGSPNYVTSGTADLVQTSTYTQGSVTQQTQVWGWNSSIPITPTINYSPVPGKSSNFYGASWLNASAASGLTTAHRNFSNAKIFSEEVVSASTDVLRWSRGNTGASGITYTGGAFMAFLGADFLSGAGEIRFDLTSSLKVTTGTTTNARTYFAVLEEGQWYLSQNSSTAPGVSGFELSSTDLLESTWALWDPTGGTNGRLQDAPSSGFTRLGSSFSDIEGFGLFVAFNTASTSGASLQWDLTSFQVNAVPEPSVAAYGTMGSLACGIFWFIRLRRRHV